MFTLVNKSNRAISLVAESKPDEDGATHVVSVLVPKGAQGTKDVSDEDWEVLKPRAKPVLRMGMLVAVKRDEDPGKTEGKLAEFNVREAAEYIKNVTDIAELHELRDGETRQTVLAALDRRAGELSSSS